MIKKLSIIVLIACCSYTAKSQFIHSIEYKAGISVSAINWEVRNTRIFPDDYIGFTTGINVKYLNHNYWNISTQLGYTQIGGSEIVQYATVTGESLEEGKVGNRMDYINLNTLLEVKYTFKKFTPSFKFGPHVDYLASANSYADNFNRFNYGIDLGGGINYAINTNIYISAEYNYYWFYDKIKTSALEVSITKNASLLIGIGYKF